MPETAIRRFLALLVRPARILVAISGGSDSTGLLLALAEALKAGPDPQISLCAATVDHALRAGSAEEARQVAALCASYDIPHVTRIWSGDKPKAGIMAAAREARYELLADAADALGANVIATAHTLDDQRETLLMREARSGTAVAGIADAMLFDRRIWIVRPLLGVTRAATRALLEARGVSWIDDPSNEDMKYERVRVRARIAEEGGFASPAEPELRLGIPRDAADWLDRHFRLHGGILGQVASEGLDADLAVLDYALGRLTAVFGGLPFAPGRAQMERLSSFIARREPGRMTVGRVVFDLRKDGLYLCRESRGILPLVLPPVGFGVWDGRFEVRNGSASTVRIEAAKTNAPSFLCLSQESSAPTDVDAEDTPSRFVESFTVQTRGGWIPVTSTGMREGGEGLPKAAWKRAIAASPTVVSAGKGAFSAELAAMVSLSPYFAPFDRFLTRFDFTFANRLSAVFARAPYAQPALRSIDGKTI